MHAKSIIGSNILIDVANHKNIPAKVDTGADSSAIWASDINISKDNILEFRLFDKTSPFYTGEIIKKSDYKAVVTRSSHGEEKLFYRTHLSAKIDGHKIRVLFTLSDRSRNNFPVLIGKRTIKNKFIVDVSIQPISVKKHPQTVSINKELKSNPIKFHQKYFQK